MNKIKAIINRIIGPIGLMRLMGPMGLIGLIGPIGFLLLVGCSKDSSEELPEQKAMGFSVTLAEKDTQHQARQTTRAAAPGDGELTTAILQQEGFGVYCWYTGNDLFTTPKPTSARTGSTEPYLLLMKNQRVTYSDDQWTYTPKKYWPLNDNERLTLRAYAPYVSYDLIADAETGMPLLPVVVEKEDYQNGTQHDPLWGTSKHDGTTDADDAVTRNEVYGKLYTDYTHQMSGTLLAKDSRDGVVDWYFHHGMAKLMFNCKVIAEPGCDKVVIKGIRVSPLYKMGLLNISSSSETENYPDKPIWTECSGNLTTDIGADYLKEKPLTIMTNMVPPAMTEDYPLLEKGLLIIPRTFSGDNKMTITLTYSIDDDATPLKAVANITDKVFYGNTIYTLGLKLTPSTQGLEITLVQSAFTAWIAGGTGNHTVYNW